MRLSPGLVAALERLRTRFGLRFELLTPSLLPWVPEEGGDLFRALEREPRTARELSTMLATGRSQDVTVSGGSFALQPLRASGRPRRLVGLLAVRRSGPELEGRAGADTDGDDAHAERWADILRTFIDADLECIEGVRQERLRSRRTWAALRFLGQLTSLTTEADVARAIVHAAAVWFDVDARIYRRDLTGELALHTHLPGVEAGPTRLKDAVLAGRTRSIRVPADTEELRWASPEALLVPLSVEERSDWVFVLGGALPSEADSVVETIGQTMSAHLERLAVKRRALVRGEFEAMLMRAGRGPELTILDVLRRLIDQTGAASGVISLHENGSIRRLAAFGALEGDVRTPPAGPFFSADELMYPVRLASGARALIELRRDGQGPFTPDAALVVRQAAAVIQLWLAGNVRALQEPLESNDRVQFEKPLQSKEPREPQQAEEVQEPNEPNEPNEPKPSFVQRINEELERARRFDLGLSMLLIEFNTPTLNGQRATSSEIVSQVIDNVRDELRGSDLLGLVGPGRIAVLLVHTDVQGVASVVPRVRRRLEAVLPSVGGGMRLGRAVMSEECRTASALLTQASQDVEAIAS